MERGRRGAGKEGQLSFRSGFEPRFLGGFLELHTYSTLRGADGCLGSFCSLCGVCFDDDRGLGLFWMNGMAEWVS